MALSAITIPITPEQQAACDFFYLTPGQVAIQALDKAVTSMIAVKSDSQIAQLKALPADKQALALAAIQTVLDSVK